MYELTVLGVGSAVPAWGRGMSAQILNVNHSLYLIDCGEGTQLRMAKYKIKPSKIKAIFISHLHGDHIFGLVGLLSSLDLRGKTEPLTIYGPEGLQEIIVSQFRCMNTLLSYPLHFQAVDTRQEKIVFADENIVVSTIPLEHRVECSGYLFREPKKRRRLRVEKFPEGFPVYLFKHIKDGQDVEWGGDVYKAEKYSDASLPSLSYAYCSDTRPTETYIPVIEGVDLLYHEATFENAHEDRANRTFHSTARQAAQQALKANVKSLLIGHFSSRYGDLSTLLKEAKEVFGQVTLAREGGRYTLRSSQ